MTIVSPCKWMDDVIQKSYLNKYNHLVINNGVSVDEFANYRKKRSKILLAVASVWDRRKNIEYVLNLSKKLEKVGNKLLESDFKICKKYANAAIAASIENIEIIITIIIEIEYLFFIISTIFL